MRILELLAGTVLLCAGSARADVVFSNLAGLNLTFYPVYGSFYHSPLSMAAAFTPGSNYTLTDAEVRVFGFIGSELDVSIARDSSGLPGSAIEQIGFGLTAPATPAGGLVTAKSIATPISLNAGTRYWLVLKASLPTSNIGWFAGGTASVPLAQEVNGTWSALTAGTAQFQIDGTAEAVPEPAAGLPLGSAIGVLLLAGMKRNRSQGF